jgi:hypothetical protein
MTEHPPSKIDWRVWAAVVLLAALLSGPVIPKILDGTWHPGGDALPAQMLRPLTRSELERKSTRELRILRNEIYARHGRRFDDPDLRSYFEAQRWYRGAHAPAQFRDEWLTPVERANAMLISEIEASRR